jgi:hypothetical protein
MATSTLIQKLFASDESGVGEDSVKVSNRQETEIFFASEAIVDGDIVCLDISKTSDGDKMSYVKKGKTDAAATAVCIGIADQSVEAGDLVRVVIKGFKAGANIATGVGQGERFVGSGTAGRGELLANSSTLPALGYVVTTAAANVAPVIVIKQI